MARSPYVLSIRKACASALGALIADDDDEFKIACREKHT
jgi:hypothetical protein